MEKSNKNKLNLFFCINNLEKGGAEKQLNYISNYLSLKYNVYIFTSEKTKLSYNFKSNIKIYVPKNMFFPLFFIKKLINLKPNFVFFILPKSYFIFGSILIFFPNISSILMRRSLNYYHKNKLFKYYEIFLHKFTNHFICNSYAAKKNLVNTEYVPEKKVSVIDNYIVPNKPIFKIKRNLKFKILCISNFYAYKGHQLLLRSLSLIKNIPWELYLMGVSKDINIKDVKKDIVKLGIKKKVKFIKKIKNDYAYPYFSLGALFSETESFPNVILEYFQLKLPIIAFNVGDIGRLINKNNGLILKKRDKKHISQKILSLYFDKNLKCKSKNSHLSLKKFTSRERTLAKFDKIIEKLYVRNNW